MLLGKVKWFDNNRGFGFILPLDESEKENGEVFVHHERIKKNGFKTLKENQLVNYIKTETVNGIMAEKVIPIESSLIESMESIIVDFCKSFFAEQEGEHLNKLIYGISQIFIYKKMKDASIKMTKDTVFNCLDWIVINDIYEDRKYPIKVKKGLEIYLAEIDFDEMFHNEIIQSFKK
jgi:CspA family cold shock protein